MPVHIQLRRGAAAEWSTVNALLAEGELGLELDTYRLKVGDGFTRWNSLGYATATPTDITTITAQLTDGVIPLTQKGSAGGVATLDENGFLTVDQLPALAITDTHVVADLAARLALTAQVGDVAIQLDTQKTYILAAAGASTAGNWKEIVGAGYVTSVDGQTGAVNLSNVYDSKGGAAQALVDARAYADTQDSALHTTITGEVATAKSQAISTAEGYTDTKVAALVNSAPAVLDTLNEIAAALGNDANYAASVTTAIAAAKTDAEAYADGKVADEATARGTAVTAAITTAEGYADTKVAAEATARDAAIATAKSQAISTADTNAGSALSTAIAGEVTARDAAIATAKSEAISTAEGYADTAVGSEATARTSAISSHAAVTLSVHGIADTSALETKTGAQSKADTAEGNAKSYADTVVGTEATARTTAIATAKSEAITTAEGYADTAVASEATARGTAIANAIAGEVTSRNSAIATAKSEAIAASEGYTDTAISGLVNGAPAALNTLKELSDALGADASYAASVTAALSSKAPLESPQLTGAVSISANTGDLLSLTYGSLTAGRYGQLRMFNDPWAGVSGFVDVYNPVTELVGKYVDWSAIDWGTFSFGVTPFPQDTQWARVTPGYIYGGWSSAGMTQLNGTGGELNWKVGREGSILYQGVQLKTYPAGGTTGWQDPSLSIGDGNSLQGTLNIQPTGITAYASDWISNSSLTSTSLTFFAGPFNNSTTLVITKDGVQRNGSLITLSANGVFEYHIADGNVSTRNLALGSVTTEKIADANVTGAKIQDGAVTNAKIADATLTDAKLVDGTITNAKLAQSSITVNGTSVSLGGSVTISAADPIMVLMNVI